MSNNSNRTNVPEAREAMDKFKMEVANEIGVPLTNGYNGNLTSAQMCIRDRILGIPASSRFLSSALARELLISLDTSSPSPKSLAPSWVLLPPGAAHRSSTRAPGSTGSSSPGVMALGSWR